MKDNQDINFCKMMLLQPIVKLSLHPDLIDKMVLDKDYIKYKKLFYSCVVDLLNKFDVENTDRLNYIASNVIEKQNIMSKEELIELLNLEGNNIDRNDRFIATGFRAIYVLLDDNLNIISPEYICSINECLSSFFLIFKDKDMLLSGYGITIENRYKSK